MMTWPRKSFVGAILAESGAGFPGRHRAGGRRLERAVRR